MTSADPTDASENDSETASIPYTDSTDLLIEDFTEMVGEIGKADSFAGLTLKQFAENMRSSVKRSTAASVKESLLASTNSQPPIFH